MTTGTRIYLFASALYCRQLLLIHTEDNEVRSASVSIELFAD